MPSPRRRPSSGQAAAEYVALLCVLAAAMAAVGAVAAGTGVPDALGTALRRALCTVGGDICSTAQARAAGLDPCVVDEERYASRWTASGLVFTSSQEHAYRIAERSDGRMTVTAGHDRSGGVGVRAGVRLGPASASARAGLAAGWRSGMVWELDGPGELRRFLRRAPKPHRLEHDADWRRAGLPPPDVRYVAGGAAGELTARVEAGVVLPLVSAGGRAALGRRVGPDGTTWFFDVPGAAATLLGGTLPEAAAARTGPWSAEIEAGPDGRVERLVLRSSAPGGRDGEEAELTRTVELGRPAAARAARDLLNPHRAVAAARALAGMGVLQRDVYRLRQLGSSLDGELAVAVVGLGHQDDRVQRRLVSSSVVGPDGRPVHRFDCVTRAAPAR